MLLLCSVMLLNTNIWHVHSQSTLSERSQSWPLSISPGVKFTKDLCLLYFDLQKLEWVCLHNEKLVHWQVLTLDLQKKDGSIVVFVPSYLVWKWRCRFFQCQSALSCKVANALTQAEVFKMSALPHSWKSIRFHVTLQFSLKIMHNVKSKQKSQ